MDVFFNGKFVAAEQAMVPVDDRGFLYGDGLFETMRVVHRRPFRLAQHLERLARGAEYLKIPLPHTPNEFESLARQLIEKNGVTDGVLKITVTRGSGARGYTPTLKENPLVLMALHPLPPMNKEGDLQWSLVTSSQIIPACGSLASFKTLNKLTHVVARLEAMARGADEALLLNSNGEIAETASGNLFWIYQDKVCTVPTGRGVLPGITRAVVLEICQTLGLQTNKRVTKPQQLRNSQGVFITQSVYGIIPVSSFDGEAVVASPLVDQIATAYQAVLQKE